MQFESKCVRLPRHAQPELGNSWEDADSPPAMRPQDLLLGGLLLSSSTYQTSPSSLFPHHFPTLGFALNEKRLWRWFRQNSVAAPYSKLSAIFPCSFGSGLSTLSRARVGGSI